MGYYIEVPGKKQKAEQLVELYGAEILSDEPRALEDVPTGKALICVLDNGSFEAAGFCYSQREFEAFSLPDTIRDPNPPPGVHDFNPTHQRPRKWLLMDWDLTCRLTNYLE